ncbi:hypothetical protein [Bacillus altitudinis]|uniref:hypothetical protein n=1 Tax=Bacillus altitudinis TaxID=293387 RepID=UPI002101A2E7|nr:hypothetical protein [Bacillus altitudinis]UTV31982.1 hypothetical protein NM966_14520 [Bacillus altitudinis]
MAEEKRTIHVLKDEKLGVDREYVAVDRKAEVGEKIVIVEKSSDRDVYSEGDVFTANRLWGAVAGAVESDKAASGTDYNKAGVITRNEYHVLEPTDIVHIDGDRYHLEDPEKDAIKFTMEIGGNPVNIEPWTAPHVPIISGGGETYKLTPVTDDREEEEPKESDVINVLADLGVEVAELKRTAARHQAEINALHEDKVRLGEQLAKVAADDPKSLAITTDELAQIIVSLSRAGL